MRLSIWLTGADEASIEKKLLLSLSRTSGQPLEPDGMSYLALATRDT